MKQKKHKYLYWEFPANGGLQAIRMGKWKGLKKNLFKGKSKLELFDLSIDPKELNDVSTKFPEVVFELEEYLKYDMFERFGGGIGVTRMVRAMQLGGAL